MFLDTAYDHGISGFELRTSTGVRGDDTTHIRRIHTLQLCLRHDTTMTNMPPMPATPNRIATNAYTIAHHTYHSSTHHWFVHSTSYPHPHFHFIPIPHPLSCPIPRLHSHPNKLLFTHPIPTSSVVYHPITCPSVHPASIAHQHSHTTCQSVHTYPHLHLHRMDLVCRLSPLISSLSSLLVSRRSSFIVFPPYSGSRSKSAVSPCIWSLLVTGFAIYVHVQRPTSSMFAVLFVFFPPPVLSLGLSLRSRFKRSMFALYLCPVRVAV